MDLMSGNNTNSQLIVILFSAIRAHYIGFISTQVYKNAVSSLQGMFRNMPAKHSAQVWMYVPVLFAGYYTVDSIADFYTWFHPRAWKGPDNFYDKRTPRDYPSCSMSGSSLLPLYIEK